IVANCRAEIRSPISLNRSELSHIRARAWENDFHTATTNTICRMQDDNGSSSSSPVLALQDWLADLGYKKNNPLLTELLALTPNDILLDIGGGTGRIVDQMLAKTTSCEGANIVELEQKKLLYAAKKRKKKNI